MSEEENIEKPEEDDVDAYRSIRWPDKRPNAVPIDNFDDLTEGIKSCGKHLYAHGNAMHNSTYGDNIDWGILKGEVNFGRTLLGRMQLLIQQADAQLRKIEFPPEEKLADPEE